MIRIGLMVESIEKCMPDQMLFKPQKKKDKTMLTKYVEYCQYTAER